MVFYKTVSISDLISCSFNLRLNDLYGIISFMDSNILSEDEFEATIQVTAPIPANVETPAIPAIHDKINNTKQKEEALFRSGITRQKAFAVVADALEATKIIMIKVIDEEDHSISWEEKIVPDYDRREWAVEQIGKYFGDFVIKPEANDNGIRQLVIIRPTQVSDSTQAGEQRTATGVERLPRPLRVQSEALSGDVQFLGDRQDNVLDIQGDVVLGTDTE